jgi:hypothetical protein
LDEKESKERSEENTSQLAEIFDYDKLKSVIQEIIEDLKSQHKTLEMTVFKQSFTLEGETITFHLNGDIQQDIFLKIKNDILGILRRKLNNYSIHLESEIKEDDERSKKKLYTSTDKLHYLLEKSPALAELKKRFGLETDF